MSQVIRLRTRLIRFAVWAFIILAALSVVGLIFEWINLARAFPERGWDVRLVRLAILGGVNLIFTAFLAGIVGMYLWARMALSLPKLQGWHVQKPESEFRAIDADEDYTFDDYLEQEARVFSELNAYLANSWSRQVAGDYSRFNLQSVCNPETIADRNWNRTHLLKATDPIGGVLLLHGLSDSPYSLRAMGKRLHAEGYTVLWLRMPGHGTNPKALAEVTSTDWASAVEVAMKGLREVVPSELPLVIGGYSNGGALALSYTLATTSDDSLPKADAVVLFSPMIGVNPLAKITRLYHAVGLFSRNEKSKWSKIFAEIDPFKYSSWPMNANVQAWNVSKTIDRKLAKLEKSGRMSELPPVLAMQSIVDSTVVVSKLITVLFDRLTSESSELFLFDVNRMDSMSNLLNLSFEESVQPRLERADRPFRLTVMGSSKSDSSQLSLRVRDDGQWTEYPVDLSWPDGVVSLSHVAIPFPPDDPVYGENSRLGNLSLGDMSMRAEPNALMIPSSMFVRCRRNPFYGYMEDRVMHWLSETLSTPKS